MSILTDFFYALRTLRQRPGFAAVIVVTLGLGIGAATTIWSVAEALLIRPLSIPESERLVVVWERNFPRERDRNVVASANYWDWQERAASFERLAAIGNASATLTGDGAPEELETYRTTPGLLEMLGAETVHGRLFSPEETDGDVVVVSHGLWQRRFGGDPLLVGSAITINGRPRTVIGVIANDFTPPDLFGLTGTDLWVPFLPNREYGGRGLLVLGKLAPDAGLDAARTEMEAIAHQLEQEHEYNRGWGVNLVPLHEQVVGHLRSGLTALLGAVGFVLLIAGVNVASLLLVRASDRAGEIAVRGALGAGRLRLMRQLLTESVLYALLGGGAGLLVAVWGVDTLGALYPDLPRLAEVTVDAGTLAFTFALAGLMAFFFGLAPAFQISRLDLTAALGQAGRGGGRRSQHLRQVLVTVQVALALLLLVGAGLLGRSFARLLGVDPGFETSRLISARVSVPSSIYSEDHEKSAFYEDLLARVRTLPGVESASAVMKQPFDGMSIATSFYAGDQGDPGSGERPVADIRPVLPGYFETLGIPLVAGRDFDARDRGESHPVAVVTETLARGFWPGQSALGRRVHVSLDGFQEYEIVGVVGDVRHQGLDRTARSMIYLSHGQFTTGSMTLVLRTGVEPSSILSTLGAVTAELDPNVPVYRVASMEELISSSVSEERFLLVLLGLFAAVALTLAAVGLYGVLAYSVRQRTREIGIRVALGARRRSVLHLVLRQALTLVGAGLFLGSAGALGLTHLIEGLLFEVGVGDPWTYGAVVLLLTAVGALAAAVPARRAARVDPIDALRHS